MRNGGIDASPNKLEAQFRTKWQNAPKYLGIFNMLQTTAISWSNVHEHGTLWYQHLKLRKELFVDSKHWDIPHNSDVEWDQYDTGNTVYVVTHQDGQAVAASRLNPSNFASPLGTYMIKDATRGLLDGIPADILPRADAPVDKNTWEATRFTVDPTLSTQERTEALTKNAVDLAAVAKELKARKLIALMPPAYIRWLSGIGLPTTRIGPTQKDGSGDRCCVMEMRL